MRWEAKGNVPETIVSLWRGRSGAGGSEGHPYPRLDVWAPHDDASSPTHGVGQEITWSTSHV